MILYYLLVAVMPLERHPIWAQFAGSLTMIKYLGGAAVLFGLVYLLIRESPPAFFTIWPERWFGVFMLIILCSYASLGDYSQWQLSPAFSCLSFFLLFFLTRTLIDSVDRFRFVLLSIVGSVAFASLYMLRDWQKYHGFYAAYRPSGAVGDPNYFALTAVMSLPISVYLSLDRNRKYQRLFCLGCLLLTILAITLGASRGGLVGIVAMLSVIFLRSKHRLRIALLLTVLFVPPNLLLTNSPVRRLFSPTASDQLASRARTIVWKASIGMIRAHPFFGVGVGRFKPEVPQYEGRDDKLVESIAHNTYIEIAAETGPIALIVYLMIFASTFGMLERIRRRAVRCRTSFIARMAMALQASLCGGAVASFFISAEFEKMPWLFLFVAFSLPPLAKSECFRRLRQVKRAPARITVPSLETSERWA